MLCIFSVIYYNFYIIISTSKYNLKTLLKKSLLFAGYSLLAVGLCAFFLIPMYTALIETSAVGDNLPNIQYYTFTLKEFLYNHLSGVGSTVLREGIICAPNISCGIVTLSLLLLFVGNKHISLKIRICYVTILIILIFSFMYAPLDYIWHGMHVPNDLP